MPRIFTCIAILLLLIISKPADAQIKLNAGYNLSGFVGPLDVGDRRNLKLGLNLGLGYEIDLNSGLKFNPELQFSIGGTNQQFKYFYIDMVDTQEVNITRASDISLYQLNMPLLIKYGIGSKFNVLFGPYLSFLAAVKIQDEITTIITNTDGEVVDVENREEENLTTSAFENFDIGVQFGLQYQTESNINVGLRLSRGFVDITREQGFYGRGTDNTIQISFLLGFL